MYRFGFVILHYMAIDATIESIDSIENKVGHSKNVFIVVVDNGSNNGTGIQLQDRYADEPRIHVIVNQKNEGFARGNNIGFQYAKNNLHCAFICMMNNDVLITQEFFVDKCYQIYEKEKCAVIGPMIVRKDESIQGVVKGIASRKFYMLHREVIKIELLLSRLGMDTIKIARSIQGWYKKLFIFKGDKSDGSELIMQRNVRLHGCCWIFTPVFVERFNGINDKTFLYREEELLYILLKKNKLESVYDPSISVLHLEDVATDMVVTSSKQKREFVYKNQIQSMKILIDEMKE